MARDHRDDQIDQLVRFADGYHAKKDYPAEAEALREALDLALELLAEETS